MSTIAPENRTDEWLDEVRRHIEPATDPGAEFWDRWTAARYAGDRLLHRLERRAARLRARGTDLPTELLQLEHEVHALATDIDELGRRRGTGTAVAARAAALLELLPRWIEATEQETVLTGSAR
jgi:hypothetical protein